MNHLMYADDVCICSLSVSGLIEKLTVAQWFCGRALDSRVREVRF